MSILYGMDHKAGSSYPANWGDPACRGVTSGLPVERPGMSRVEVKILSTADLIEVASWVRERCGDLHDGGWDMTVSTEKITVWFYDKSIAMMFKLVWGGL